MSMAIKHSETWIWGFAAAFGIIYSVDKFFDALDAPTGRAVAMACFAPLIATMATVICWLSWRKPPA